MQGKLNIKNNNLSHSIMLLSQDDYALSWYSFYIAKILMCENENACGKCLNCQKIEHKNHADVLVFPKLKEIISVEEILDLVQNVIVLPFETDKKVYILNNFSSCSSLVQNKLLKTLEEPPKNVFFILNVSNETKVLPTIKSRCQKIHLPKYEKEEIFKSLEEINLAQSLKEDVVEFSDGMISNALKFAKQENFKSLLDLTFDVWKNLRKSSGILYYSHKFYANKEDFQQFLFLYNIILRDIIHTKLNKKDLVRSEKNIETYKIISNDFSLKALVSISNFCDEMNERVQRNCNLNIMVDNFFVKILEERAKWHQ